MWPLSHLSERLKKKLATNTLYSVFTVQIKTFEYLSRNYKQEGLESKMSDLLAVTVINEIFKNPPKDKNGETFLNKNKELIDRRIGELKNYPEILDILKKAVVLSVITPQILKGRSKFGFNDGIELNNTLKTLLKFKLIDDLESFYSSPINPILFIKQVKDWDINIQAKRETPKEGHNLY